MTTYSDRDFLVSIGVAPYEPDRFRESIEEQLRTRVLQAVAVLQLIAIIAGIVWTSI